MELYEENKQQTKSKAPMLIIILIILLSLCTIGIIFLIFYLKGSIMTVKLNGVRNTKIESLLNIEQTEQGNEIYVPILEIAEIFGYEGFYGDYKNKSEDKTKCHVISEKETAMFTLNSNILVKIVSGQENQYIELDKPVVEKNAKLYTTIDGLEKCFNLVFTSDESFKNININSMEYLVQYYANAWGILNYSDNFSDQKAIFENLLIIRDESDKYGVINTLIGKNILENKYEEIKYIPETKDFLVKSNNKYGILTKESKTKIRIIYDEIKLISNKKELYVVRQNGVYGIIDSNGNSVINIEYSQIGININQYSQNGVENGYLLLNDIIPIKNNQNLWALFDTTGKPITEFKYTSLGCSHSKISNSYPALLIEDKEIIVVQKDKVYNLLSKQGEELIPNDVVDSIYLKTDILTGKNQFYMTYNGKTADIEEWLENQRKIKNKKTEE